MIGAFRSPFLALLLGLSGVSIAVASNASLNDLLRNSPFGRTAGQAGPNKSTSLEFRGVMVEGGVYYFSIFDPASALSSWVRINEESPHDYLAKSYDAANRQLTVQYQSAELVLALVANSNPQASSPPAATIPAANGPSLSNSDRPPHTTPEAERLRKVADEIRRRRALCQQAINQTQQPNAN